MQSEDIFKPHPQEHFNREELRSLFKESSYKVGAEIGVFKGKHSEILCQYIPDLKLYCIDPWAKCGWPKVGETEELWDSYYRRAKRRLKPYNAIIIRKTSMEAVKDFPNNFFDFVHIDGDHSYDAVMNDLIEWSKRVRVGGIISGHDYDPDWAVKLAVDDYVKNNSIDNCFYSVEKRISPSFWWEKK